MNIRSGVTSEVPDLVSIVALGTGSPPPDNALYVGIYDDNAMIIGCLIFYCPVSDGAERGVKFGGALAPGRTWGDSLAWFVHMRTLIEGIVFEGFGYDFLEADVDRGNARLRRFLRSCGFADMGDGTTYRYRGRPHYE